MPIRARNIDARAVTSKKLGADVIAGKQRFCKIIFDQPVIARSALTTGVAPTGATGDLNYLFARGYAIEQHIKGIGQTIVVPPLVATPVEGLNIALDVADNEGSEYVFSGAGNIANLRSNAFKVGTDPSFYAKCTLRLTDADGSDDFIFGFRKQEAAQTSVEGYGNYAGIGFNTAADPAAIKVRHKGGSGDAVATNTDTTDTWANATTKTLKLYVDGAGNVTYKIDGKVPTVTATFKFDSGDVVVPFLFLLHAAGTAEDTILMDLEVGFQDGANDP